MQCGCAVEFSVHQRQVHQRLAVLLERGAGADDQQAAGQWRRARAVLRRLTHTQPRVGRQLGAARQ
eukprot:1778757-Prymnesium_polylepis.1